MPDTLVADAAAQELAEAEAHAAELGHQAEQISAAYRATTRRADGLRDQLRRSDQSEQHYETRDTTGVRSHR